VPGSVNHGLEKLGFRGTPWQSIKFNRGRPGCAGNESSPRKPSGMRKPEKIADPDKCQLCYSLGQNHHASLSGYPGAAGRPEPFRAVKSPSYPIKRMIKPYLCPPKYWPLALALVAGSRPNIPEQAGPGRSITVGKASGHQPGGIPLPGRIRISI